MSNWKLAQQLAAELRAPLAQLRAKTLAVAQALPPPSRPRRGRPPNRPGTVRLTPASDGRPRSPARQALADALNRYLATGQPFRTGDLPASPGRYFALRYLHRRGALRLLDQPGPPEQTLWQSPTRSLFPPP